MVKFAKFAENLTVTQSMKEKETYIGYKSIKGDNTKGFKVKINHQISDCKTVVFICKFPIVVLRFVASKSSSLV